METGRTEHKTRRTIFDALGCYSFYLHCKKLFLKKVLNIAYCVVTPLHRPTCEILHKTLKMKRNTVSCILWTSLHLVATAYCTLH